MPESSARERVGLIAIVGAALLVVFAGVLLAIRNCDPHWVNRSGSAVVALQVGAAFVEFARRQRLKRLQALLQAAAISDQSSLRLGRGEAFDGERREFLDGELSKAEMHAFTVVMLLAALGEVLHGFGDLILEFFWR
jgi:hypothetical protein